jgi:APA family basic amino acid/polyamine antiporter
MKHTTYYMNDPARLINADSLAKGVDLSGVIALGLGTAVGVAVFSIIAPATGLAGPAMLLSVMAAAVPMFVIAITYAFMGSALPTSGASYEWPRRFIHPSVGFLIAWLRIAGSVGALVVLAFVLVRYLSNVTQLPTKPTMLAAFTIVFAVNYLGIAIATRVQTILMSLLIVLFIAFAIIGAPFVRAVNFQPFLAHGWQGVVAAVPLLIGLFFGIEAATEVGEEVKNGRSMIPLGIALSIASAVAMYIGVAAVSVGVIGAPALAASQAPLLDAARAFMPTLAKPIVVTAAVVAIGKSLNALFIIFSRNLFAMGRAGALPSALARIHPKFATPYVALTVAFGACILGLLLPTDLTGLFLAVNIPTLLKYAATCISATRVVARHRDVYEAARFKLGPNATRGWAYVGALAALAIIVLGFETNWKPYAALGLWLIVGVGYYWATHKPSTASASRA